MLVRSAGRMHLDRIPLSVTPFLRLLASRLRVVARPATLHGCPHPDASKTRAPSIRTLHATRQHLPRCPDHMSHRHNRHHARHVGPRPRPPQQHKMMRRRPMQLPGYRRCLGRQIGGKERRSKWTLSCFSVSPLACGDARLARHTPGADVVGRPRQGRPERARASLRSLALPRTRATRATVSGLCVGSIAPVFSPFLPPPLFVRVCPMGAGR